jgi:hypothetical protein
MGFDKSRPICQPNNLENRASELWLPFKYLTFGFLERLSFFSNLSGSDARVLAPTSDGGRGAGDMPWGHPSPPAA